MSRAVADLEAALASGGETGRLIASTDWDRSPLGPMAAWPERLKTAIAIAMRSTFAMHISWGDDLYQFYNDAYRPVLGSTKHPAIGVPLRDTFPESFDSFVVPRFSEPLHAGRSYTSEDELLPVDRHGWLEESHFRFTYDPLGGDDGCIAGVLAICIETTQEVLDRRRLELLTELDALALAAQDPDVLLRDALGLLASTPDTPCAIVLDPDGAVVGSAGMAALGAHVGRTATEVASSADEAGRIELADLGGDVQPHLGWLAPPTHARTGWLGDRLVLLGLHPGVAWDHDYRRYVELVVRVLQAADHRLQRLSELKHHVTSLRQLDEMKDALLSDISHELRTPLMLISGAVEELAAGRSSQADAELLATASRASERLRRLVDGLMVYGQLTGGHLAPTLVPTDLRDAVADCCASFAREVERSGLDLRVELPDDAVTVGLDGHLWQTVLYNLLANAIRFTHTGSITVRVTTDAIGAVEVAVTDTGVGIPRDEHERLFDRFHRVPGQHGRTEEGAGLGLALVAEIVERHHGTVHVDGDPGVGTTFTIRLPRWDDVPRSTTATAPTASSEDAEDREGSAADTPAPAPGGAPAATDPARILIVEDNDELRAMLARVLGRTWRVETVGNGREALEALDDRSVDLVVTDAMMPVMDGPALIANLRARPATSDVPILLLTGRNDPADAVGADAMLHKPFPLARLVEIVGGLLQVPA